MNGNQKNNVTLSGKTVVVDYGGYVAEMDMENFIPCVLMAQMPIESPIEALKAQSVVIRTYILKQMGEETSIDTKTLELPFISYGKMQDIWFRDYRMRHPDSLAGMLGNLSGLGKSRIFQQNIDYLHKIIEKTSGKVLKNKGELILPLFHGISNGVTRKGSELLGSEYAYLKSVTCDTDINEENYMGMQYLSLEQFKNKLAEKEIVLYRNKKELFADEDIDINDFISLIDCSNKDTAGYLISVKIADTEIIAERFAEALGLASTSMEISEYEKGIRIQTKGEGHGFGMSLAYAEQLAKEGMNWQKILKTFYDATIKEYD
jgi:stage II sporulation protein D